MKLIGALLLLICGAVAFKPSGQERIFEKALALMQQEIIDLKDELQRTVKELKSLKSGKSIQDDDHAEIWKHIGYLEDDRDSMQTDLLEYKGLISKAETDINYLKGITEFTNSDIEELQTRSRKSAVCGYTDYLTSAGTAVFTTTYQEVEEVGSVLEASTGIYTAGVDGIYEVSVSGICSVSSGEEVTLSLYGGQYDAENMFFVDSYSYEGDIRDQCSASRQMKLMAGDQIYMDYSVKGSPSIGRLKFCVTLY